MLIDLTQHTTRCSDRPGQAIEELSCAHSAVEAEAELIKVRLEFGASAMVGSTQKILEIAECSVKPVQIAGGVLLRPDFHILQVQIALVAITLNVDIGVGDVIVPNAQRRNIQTQLDGYEKPEILTYSLESTIAEKFDAILQRFELTGRMKDFYDIYYLSRTFDFEGLKLQTAIRGTLKNRGTAYEKDSFERVLALADAPDMQTKWRYFLRTLGNSDIPFQEVIDGLKCFLEPVWNAIIFEEETQICWTAANSSWTK